MKEKIYKSVIKNAAFGYACHEIIFDKKGNRSDYRIIDVNPAFEEMTGLSSSVLEGSLISELYNKNESQTEINSEFYDNLSLAVERERIEYFSEKSKRWYDVQVIFSDGGYITTLFEDITSLKSLQTEMNQTGYLIIENERLIQMSKSLFDSDLSYKSLFDQTIDAIFVLDKEGIFIDVNPAALRMYGYEPNELIGFTPEKLTAPGRNDMELNSQRISRAYNGEPQRFEWWGMRKNGEIFPKDLVLNKTSYFGRDVVFAQAREITERLNVLEALRESEDKFRSLTEQVPVGVYRTTIDGRLVYSNMALANILEYDSVDELLDINVSQLYADPASRQKQLKIAGKKSGIVQSEFQLRKKNGQLIWVRDNSRLLTDKTGSPIYFDGILEDITEKKQAEIAVKENEANLKAIIENTLENIWSVNLSYEIEYVNEVFAQAFKQTFGVQLSPGVNIIDSLPEGLNHLWKGRYDRAFKNEHFLFEDKIDFNGSSIYVEVAMNPIVIDSKVVGVSVYGRDVTANKLAEQKLIDAKEKAEESDRLKSAFLANMSHEIRTPMSGIIGFLNLLNEPDLSDENKTAYINIVTQSGHRLLDTINDIIEISRIETGGLQVNSAPVNVSELFGYYSGLFRQQTAQKGLEYIVTNNLPAEISFFSTDRKKLDSIISNLIKNAIKFTPSGRIEFNCRLKESNIVFCVKDSGVGIAEDRIKSIFDRFVQGDISSTRPHEGSGLGLSIVKAYIELLQGSISVQSKVGTGTAFTFSIPYESVDEAKTVPPDPLIPEQIQISAAKILIAEDDYASYLYIQKALSAKGITFLRTTNGDDTIKEIKENPDITLILMDIKMPGMSGLEATRMIREFNTEVPIIAQTAYSLSGDRELAIKAGCTDYISKPINRRELQSLVKKHTGLNL